MHSSWVKPFNCYLWSFVWIQRLVEHNMDIRDVPLIVGEIIDNFGVMNDDNKRNNSLEMVERRVFPTCWTADESGVWLCPMNILIMRAVFPWGERNPWIKICQLEES